MRLKLKMWLQNSKLCSPLQRMKKVCQYNSVSPITQLPPMRVPNLLSNRKAIQAAIMEGVSKTRHILVTAIRMKTTMGSLPLVTMKWWILMSKGLINMEAKRIKGMVKKRGSRKRSNKRVIMLILKSNKVRLRVKIWAEGKVKSVHTKYNRIWLTMMEDPTICIDIRCQATTCKEAW